MPVPESLIALGLRILLIVALSFFLDIVIKFEESGVAIKILGTTKPIKQWDVMDELRKRIKEAFDREGIEIPLPHRVVIGHPPPAGEPR